MYGYNDHFWKGRGQPGGAILYGCIGEEQDRKPGVYRFCSTNGIIVNDAHILSGDADIDDNGEIKKPRPGSPCVAVMSSDGSQCFVIGFHRPPKFDEMSDDIPSVGNPDDNESSGDKVYQTSGGARLILKRGGAVIVEGGPGVNIIANPLNNRLTLRSANYAVIADGYRSFNGREKIGSTDPRTIHEEEFLHQVGPTFDRVKLSQGSVGGDARRRLELASVTVTGTQEIATVVTRETYNSDGSWVGEGPKYQWGAGADEPAVLGNQLVSSLEDLIDAIKALKVNTAWGPSTPPLPQTQIELNNIKTELSGKILSTFLFLSKNPSQL